jgi:hypothetical protein
VGAITACCLLAQNGCNGGGSSRTRVNLDAGTRDSGIGDAATVSDADPAGNNDSSPGNDDSSVG